MLTEEQAIVQAGVLKGYQIGERGQLDLIRRYWKGLQRLPAVLPSNAPREVKELARISRVNICEIVIDSLAQSTFVDNFRSKDAAEDLEVWDIWQRNKLDARQTGVHRAAFAYGTSYVVVTPGDPVPVIRGVSPRHLTALYGDDPDWPVYALEFRGKGVQERDGGNGRQWRLYDKNAVYELESNGRSSQFNFVNVSEHGAGVCPIIRYLDKDDLTTFDLKVAEHYSAFRQRWIVGWLAQDEAEKMKASAAQLWTFEDDEKEIKLGEFSQTDLNGYLDSRTESMRHGATLSQTPVHELIGDLVNLSAEALVAAEQGHERKVDERKTMLGESWEQTLRLAAKLKGVDVPPDAEVVWRDTSARAYSATIDALGKLVTMLGVPPQETWAKIPGVTKQDVERWKAEAQQGDAFAQLQAILDKQSQPPTAVA